MGLLKGVTSYNRDSVENNLLYGLIDFFNWGFLEIGAFQNIGYGTESIGGNSRARLRPVADLRYASNAVWEGFRGNWVWESGMANGNPYRPSTVKINGVTYTNGDSVSWNVDYPRGRLIFSSGISPSSTVETSFAHKSVSFIDAEEQWVRHIFLDSYNIDTKGSGSFTEWNDTKIHLPAVAVKISSVRTKPYQLSGGQWVLPDVEFWITATNGYELRQITDAIALQNDRTVWIPNRGLMKQDTRYPFGLDYQGDIRPNTLYYPDLINPTGFLWNGVYLRDVLVTHTEPINNLFRSKVRFGVEIVAEDI